MGFLTLDLVDTSGIIGDANHLRGGNLRVLVEFVEDIDQDFEKTPWHGCKRLAKLGGGSLDHAVQQVVSEALGGLPAVGNAMGIPHFEGHFREASLMKCFEFEERPTHLWRRARLLR